MKYSHYIGIDPGKKGAIACLNASGSAARSYPMPVKKARGEGEPQEYDLDGLYHVFGLLRRLPNVRVGVEWPVAYPGTFGNVARDAEQFGRGKGYLHAFLWMMGFDFSMISPLKWKQKLGLPGKSWDAKSEQGRALWVAKYPHHAQTILGPRGGLLDGPLDALLIAHYMRIGGEEPCGHKGGRRPAIFRGGPSLF